MAGRAAEMSVLSLSLATQLANFVNFLQNGHALGTFVG